MANVQPSLSLITGLCLHSSGTYEMKQHFIAAVIPFLFYNDVSCFHIFESFLKYPHLAAIIATVLPLLFTRVGSW